MYKSHRCGVCPGCQAEMCGKCCYCLDSPRFGGHNLKKQTCIFRRCLALLEPKIRVLRAKYRKGCQNCAECQDQDCGICLVCLEKIHFRGSILPDALCYRKKCKFSERTCATNVIPDQPAYAIDNNGTGNGTGNLGTVRIQKKSTEKILKKAKKSAEKLKISLGKRQNSTEKQQISNYKTLNLESEDENSTLNTLKFTPSQKSIDKLTKIKKKRLKKRSLDPEHDSKNISSIKKARKIGGTGQDLDNFQENFDSDDSQEEEFGEINQNSFSNYSKNSNFASKNSNVTPTNLNFNDNFQKNSSKIFDREQQEKFFESILEPQNHLEQAFYDIMQISSQDVNNKPIPADLDEKDFQQILQKLAQFMNPEIQNKNNEAKNRSSELLKLFFTLPQAVPVGPGPSKIGPAGFISPQTSPCPQLPDPRNANSRILRPTKIDLVEQEIPKTVASVTNLHNFQLTGQNFGPTRQNPDPSGQTSDQNPPASPKTRNFMGYIVSLDKDQVFHHLTSVDRSATPKPIIDPDNVQLQMKLMQVHQQRALGGDVAK